MFAKNLNGGNINPAFLENSPALGNERTFNFKSHILQIALRRNYQLYGLGLIGGSLDCNPLRRGRRNFCVAHDLAPRTCAPQLNSVRRRRQPLAERINAVIQTSRFKKHRTGGLFYKPRLAGHSHRLTLEMTGKAEHTNMNAILGSAFHAQAK